MSDTPNNTKANGSKRAKKASTIRIGKRYRANRLDGNYDAIIIGSGIGGLTTAASLSSAGKKVLVLEQHYTAGGFTHSYSREGYEWDVGVHYIGDVGYPTMTRKLFDFVTDGKLKWAAMDKVYDRIFLGDESFDFVTGKKQFIDELKQCFPKEHSAIDQYMKLLSQAGAGMRVFTLTKLFSPFFQKLLVPFINFFQPKCLNKTTYEVLSSLTSDQKLIAVLTGQWGDCGVPPKKSSFLIHSLIAKHYLNGGYFPVGGASKIPENIIPKIQSSGGEVFTYATVTEILVEKGVAVGVKMADGTEIRSPIIVSNAGVFNTFNKLVPSAISKKFGYEQKLKFVKPSCTNVGLFIGLKETSESLQLPKTNFWIYLDHNHDKNIDTFHADPTKPLPVIYISFPSAKDPSFEQRHPGRATIEIVAPAFYDTFTQWKGTTWGKRGEEYDSLSDFFAEQMLEALYKKMPHLKGKIDYYEVSTPLSTEHFCHYDQGEIYGLEHDPERFKQGWLQPKTKISGLWLTGQDILSCGVSGAMIAGFMTAAQILGVRKGFDLAKKALSEKKEPVDGWVVSEP